MSYSQNREDELILNYFNGQTGGTILDIGANDGRTFSNSLLFIQNFWSATLVEPSKDCFEKLLKLHHNGSGANFNVVILNHAIGEKAGQAAFYESDTLLGKGDKALVSTLHLNETARWRGGVKFETKETDVVTFEQMLSMTKFKTYDFISVDAEGEDLNILKQIDFDKLECKCVCVEFNGLNEQEYWNVVQPFGFKLLHKNAENLIYVR